MAALGMCVASAAIAQDTMSNDMHWRNTWKQDGMMHKMFSGERGTVKAHAMTSLNAGEQWHLWNTLRYLTGTEEDIYIEALAKAVDRNANDMIMRWPGYAVFRETWTRTSGLSTTGTANQPMTVTTTTVVPIMVVGYPNDRDFTMLGDMEAFDVLKSGLTDSERGVVDRTWGELPKRTQDAMLKLVKMAPASHIRLLRMAEMERVGMNWMPL